MIIKFDKGMVQNNPSIFEHIESKSLPQIVWWVIDWRFRKSTYLSGWLKGFVDNPPQSLIDIAKTIPDSKEPDHIVTDCLRWVQQNIKYESDKAKWDVDEVWDSPTDVLENWYIKQNGKLKLVGIGSEKPKDYPQAYRCADCESGALIIYLLCVLKGIQPNRLLIMCGDVLGGGHAYVGYKPTEYPLNWTFLDWCYWYDSKTPSARQKFYIKDQTIYDPNKKYLTLWFGFNHLNSYKGLRNKGE
jgi:hypothetical protein